MLAAKTHDKQGHLSPSGSSSELSYTRPSPVGLSCSSTAGQLLERQSCFTGWHWFQMSALPAATGTGCEVAGQGLPTQQPFRLVSRSERTSTGAMEWMGGEGREHKIAQGFERCHVYCCKQGARAGQGRQEPGSSVSEKRSCGASPRFLREDPQLGS